MILTLHSFKDYPKLFYFYAFLSIFDIFVMTLLHSWSIPPPIIEPPICTIRYIGVCAKIFNFDGRSSFFKKFRGSNQSLLTLVYFRFSMICYSLLSFVFSSFVLHSSYSILVSGKGLIPNT